MGRGRDSHSAQQGQQQGRQQGQPPYGQPAPYGQQGPYGSPPMPPQGQWQQGPRPPHPGRGQQPPQPYGAGPGPQYDEPEYFGDGGGYAPHQQGHAPYSNDNSPGSTRQFSIGEGPDSYGPQSSGQYGGDGYGRGGAPYGNGQEGDGGQYAEGGTYRAGEATAPPVGPRLPWQQLLTGIVLRPDPTFWRMRDHQVWGPALIVTFVYGLLAVFGFDKAREDVLNATLSNSIPWVLITAVMFVLGGLILGTVTHTLARQLGGNGSWQPTVGLSMLIMTISDAPRLIFAMFLGGDSTLVQVIGWLTWLASGYLFTSMVSKSHDLPWPKALGASAIQLAGLLALVKLGTL
ncbi:YIP1 family protein [Streptomyces sp. NPDC003077]|uniref:Yip1 family protein n=1 Tax=Streptomyces sp. NPDC003077 TaxID=3154443 RepID=UPI0033B8525E